MTRTVYQDLDPLGDGQWFAYESEGGHIVATYGPFLMEEDAHGHPICDHCGGIAPDRECPMCDRKCDTCGHRNYDCECPDVDEWDIEQESD